MRREGAPRRLTADGTVWLWSVRHRHPDCRTVLSLRRTEHPHAQLRLVFRDAPGRVVAGFTTGSGELAAVAGGHLNLNEPGVVRVFLDAAGARGLLPTTHGVREEDGWPLFDAVASTPEPHGTGPSPDPSRLRRAQDPS
ncbi:hypothetical protein [Streptomyces zaomyceticus]|uniref:hypothetical protein n=1 Tax=Streptomyces zaomyceticus TaxID=68286 RepID=UPI002E14C865|nr:hypothetical protein OG237_14790 [Streptomyces zaomyceticus]